MKCVHIDGDSSLTEGLNLTLLKSSTFYLPPVILEWARELFPDGLSTWGWRCIPFIYAIDHGIFNERDRNFSNSLIEYEFEAIRRRDFPQMPSRLQCMFAAATIEDLFNDWPTLFKANSSFWEISCNASYSMDATFLDAYAASVGHEQDDSASGIENIYKYWRCERSPSPRIELLLPLSKGIHIENCLSIQN